MAPGDDDHLPPGPARDLVDLLRRLRARHGITNKQAALRSGLSPSYVSELLGGRKTPRPPAAARLAAAMGGTDADAWQARLCAEKQAELDRYHRDHAKRGHGQPRTPSLDSPAQAVRFRLLGPVQVHCGDRLAEVGGATARAVLALLLLRGATGVSTDEIITTVWGGPGGATRDSVYHYLSGLRKALAGSGAVLETRQPRYRLAVDADVVDWHRFRRLVREAHQARDGQEADRASALLREALGLWTGPPLADAGGRLGAFRRDMSEQRRAATELLADVEAARGHPGEVVALLRDGLLTGPLRERAAALVIDALTALGRRDEAGELYRRTRARLAGEQGLDPSAPLEAAYRRMLGAATAVPAEPASAAPVTVLPVSGLPISGLPRVDPHFTGRSHELRAMAGVLRQSGAGPVCVIHGMGGCGKTALAVSAAHLLAGSFPDGVIFLDLHGYTENRAALTAAEALDRLLRRMRVDGRAIPPDTDERAALYHDVLAARRTLLILDNARDGTQLRHLLPTGSGSAAIVTSRRTIAALDDALTLPLGAVPEAEAVAMFEAVAGHGRVHSEPAAADLLIRITHLCGRLPLAIRIAAGRYRARDNGSLEDLAGRLSTETGRLRELDDEDRSVAASFRVSLSSLSPALARTFGLLAAYPGSDFGSLAVAALADLPTAEAARQCSRLADRHLITETAPGRYQFHDLIGAFARNDTLAKAAAPEQAAALRRVADFFLRAAQAADSQLTPNRYRVPVDVLSRTVALPRTGTYDTALAWMNVEESNIADTCVAAGAAGHFTVCWQLAYTMRGYYFLSKSVQPWLATHEAALAAARRCGDARAEALTVSNLGLAHLEQGGNDMAAQCYRQARQLFGAAADPHGEHTARANLAWVLFREGRFPEFLAEMRPVLDFYQRVGAERNAAITMRGIGLAETELGLTTQAISHLRHALEISTKLAERLDTAMAWNGLGEAYQRAGDSQGAASAFAEALASSELAGSQFEQARAHHRLGQLAAAAGEREAAHRHWAEALRRYRQLASPQAAQVQREIGRLEGSR